MYTNTASRSKTACESTCSPDHSVDDQHAVNAPSMAAAPWFDDGLCAAIKDDSNFSDKCQALAADIKHRAIELVTLVERLGAVLTDVDPDIRLRGTQILALVLKDLPRDFLSNTELSFITSFFCDRFNDHNSVIPAVLQGVLAISDMTYIQMDDVCRIVSAMFRHVHCQSHLHVDRNNYYQILNCFMNRATKELQAMGPDFVFGVLTAMDGERDPRNLLFLFQTLPTLLRLFPPGHLTEDMFEVIACYFPVDFHSSSNDPGSVTRDDLAGVLTTCLTALPDFAEFCIPLLLEKLDSSLRIAKMDSLAALRVSCEVFPVKHIEQHLSDMWGSLKLEVLPGGDAELKAIALATLRALVMKLSADKSELLNKLLDNILAAGRDALRQVDLSLFSPAVCLLTTAATGSQYTCKYITREVIPLLMSQCNNERTPLQKAQILHAITGLLSVCGDFHECPNNVAGLFELYAEAREHVELRVQRLCGAAALVRFLDDELRSKLYKLLGSWVHSEETTRVRDELRNCLKTASRYYPDEILEKVVYPQLSLDNPNELNDLTLSRRVNTLCSLASLERFTSVVGPQVLRLITEFSTVDKCNVGIQGLKELVAGSSDRVNELLFVQCGCISLLTTWWLQGLRDDRNPEIFHNLSLLEGVSHIVYHVVRTQSARTQNDVISDLLPAFFESQPCHFQPLLLNSPAQQTRSILLLEGILGAIRREVEIPALLELGQRMIELANSSPDGITKERAARILAIIVNKASDLELVSTLVAGIKSGGGRSTPLVVTWLTKALLLRGHPMAGEMIATLISLLETTEHGLEAAQGFNVLLDNSGDYLNAESHCNMRVLYKQRLFMSAPSLASKSRLAPDHLASNYHVAIAHLLQKVPRDVLTIDIAQTVSLLVECLLVDEMTLLQATLGTISNLAQSSQPLLADHLSTLVPRCLKLAQSHQSMKVRIAASECIYHFTTYSTTLLLPFKQDVLRGLASCVDDRKRLVRRAAVTSRTRWFLVGAPGESKSN